MQESYFKCLLLCEVYLLDPDSNFHMFMCVNDLHLPKVFESVLLECDMTARAAMWSFGATATVKLCPFKLFLPPTG